MVLNDNSCHITIDHKMAILCHSVGCLPEESVITNVLVNSPNGCSYHLIELIMSISIMNTKLSQYQKCYFAFWYTQFAVRTHSIRSITWCKTAVSPLLMHGRYHSLALNHGILSCLHFLTKENYNILFCCCTPLHVSATGDRLPSKNWNSWSVLSSCSPYLITYFMAKTLLLPPVGPFTNMV